MVEVQVIATCTVQPAAAAEGNGGGSSGKVELTSWDLSLLLLNPIQKGLLFLKPRTNQQEKNSYNNLTDHLKKSLSRTLDFFPPLAGRLATIKNEDNTTSFFIDCNNAGAQFTGAIADGVTVSDILTPINVPRIVHSFFPLNGIVNLEGISKPLLAVQITELVDGFFIGCAINHSVADGTSFWHFFNSWSELSCGLDCISKPPVLTRWFPDETSCPIRIPGWVGQIEQHNDEFIFPPMDEGIFHFSKESIAKLKARANTEMGIEQISSFQALLAHIWRSVVCCRQSDTDREFTLRMAIGARTRLEPPLADGYFGNAIHIVAVTITAGELLSHGFGWAALQINKVVMSQSCEKVKDFVKRWTENPRIVKPSMIKDSVLLSSSPRFNMYGNDFGWGKPIAVRSGMANKFNEKITIFPGEEFGSVDIELCLLPETLQAVVSDAEFMDAVTIPSY